MEDPGRIRGPGYARGTSMEPPMTANPRIAFLATQADDALAARADLSRVHGQCAPEDAGVLCPLGGDGFMLQTLPRHGGLGKPVYGLNLGLVGFLMNHDRADAESGRMSCRDKRGQDVSSSVVPATFNKTKI